MRSEIKALHQRLKTTTVYVTHDQVEAMTMADRIVVMRSGVIQQVGIPREVYARPNNTFVATFVGSPQMNLFRGRVEDGRFVGDGLAVELVPDLLGRSDSKRTLPGDVTLGIRPEDALLVGPGEDGAIAGVVALVEPVGSDVYLNLALEGGASCVVRVPGATAVGEQERVHVRFVPGRIHLFGAEGTRAG